MSIEVKTDKEMLDALTAIYIGDLKKPEIDKFMRAAIIRDTLLRLKISGRDFARRTGVPHSTVQDWLLYANITEEEYAAQRKNGLRPVDIYRNLREQRTKTGVTTAAQPQTMVARPAVHEIDTFLMEIRTRLRGYMKSMHHTPKTASLIDELVNDLNNYSVEINLRMKRGR
jgi:hypothetical protein